MFLFRTATRLDIAKNTLIITGFGVLISLAVYLAITTITGSFRPVGIIISLAVPMIISPPVSIIILRINRSLYLAKEEILRAREELEVRVAERTRELNRVNEQLREEIQIRKQAEEQLSKLNELFLRFGADPVANINLLVAFCGEMFSSTCALYNRLQDGMLCALGQWNAPADFRFIDQPEGRICYDVINSDKDHVSIIRNLQDSIYAETDPNVRQYRLQTYIGRPVNFRGTNIGSLCVAFQRDIIPTDNNIRLMGIISSAIGVEEERKWAEKALRKSEERFRGLLQAVPALAVQGYLHDGTTTYWNQASEMLYGYTAEEAIGQNLLKLIVPPEIREDAKSAVQQMVKTGQAIPASEMSFIRKDGSRVAVFSSHAIIHVPGQPPELFSMDIDLTERKQIEKELLRVQKLESLGILAGGIAHDFNNLLTIILGNIELALSSLPADHASYPFLKAAIKSAGQTSDLTGRLITFSRGGFSIKRINDISGILRTSVEKIIRGTGIQVTFDIEENLWPVEVDDNQIRQVFYNLAMNAAEAMPEGGILNIEAKNTEIQDTKTIPLQEGAYLMIIFADTGKGIAEQALSSIFDPYFTTKEMGNKKGTGLGLSVCYSVLKKHNGYIAAASTPGKGTAFTLYLPALVDKAGLIKKSKGTAPSLHAASHRVLIMEDEVQVLELERAFLEKLGYEVMETKDGQEAIDCYKEALLSHKPFDMVLLDLIINQGPGGMLTMERLLKEDPYIKAIIVSGYQDDPSMEHYRDYGFKGMLKKPFNFKELEEIVKKVAGSGA